MYSIWCHVCAVYLNACHQSENDGDADLSLTMCDFVLSLIYLFCSQASFSPSSAALVSSVSLVWPQLEKQRNLKKKALLLEGLIVSAS